MGVLAGLSWPKPCSDPAGRVWARLQAGPEMASPGHSVALVLLPGVRATVAQLRLRLGP